MYAVDIHLNTTNQQSNHVFLDIYNKLSNEDLYNVNDFIQNDSH